MLEPVHAVRAPVLNSDHHVLDLVRHGFQVIDAVIYFKDYSTIVLGQRRCVTHECQIILMELCFDVEDLISVDSVLYTWTEIVIDVVEDDIDGALSSAVAVLICALRGRRITFMRRSTIGELVCLHYIELRAEMTTDLRCITVLERIVQVVCCWHRHSIESCKAATAGLAEIDVE